ncbi:MAG: hypothetical protein HUU56_05880 [Bdellovibrionaceae bacterium]|nr:hypothetical protein [Pseudobdellovibrionaceae bacterium]
MNFYKKFNIIEEMKSLSPQIAISANIASAKDSLPKLKIEYNDLLKWCKQVNFYYENAQNKESKDKILDEYKDKLKQIANLYKKISSFQSINNNEASNGFDLNNSERNF